MIPRNTAIPTSRSRLFYTLHSEQDTVEVKVYQGEDRDLGQDELLGRFRFEGLCHLPTRRIRAKSSSTSTTT